MAREDQIFSNARRNAGTLRIATRILVGDGGAWAPRPALYARVDVAAGIVGRTLSSAANAVVSWRDCWI